MAIFNTITTPIDLPNPPIDFPVSVPFLRCWSGLSTVGRCRPAWHRFRVAFGTFCGTIFSALCEMRCPPRACVHVWHVCGWCGPLMLLQGSILWIYCDILATLAICCVP